MQNKLKISIVRIWNSELGRKYLVKLATSILTLIIMLVMPDATEQYVSGLAQQIITGLVSIYISLETIIAIGNNPTDKNNF